MMILSTSLDAFALNLRIASITPRYYPRCVSPVPSASSLIPPRAEAILKRCVEDPATGCWNWQGKLSHDGYGRTMLDRKLLGVHRAVWILLRGPIADGLTIDHLCRNRHCVNPDHLEPVTMRENLLRGNAMSTINRNKTACKHGHAFTEDNTFVAAGKYGPRRYCRACWRRRAMTSKPQRLARIQKQLERSVGRSDLPLDHENPSAYQARIANLQRARRIRREKRRAAQMKLFRGES